MLVLLVSIKEEIRYMKGEMDEDESGEAMVAGAGISRPSNRRHTNTIS
jgi:hypothetical protein